jgi:hypothetical protein
VKLNVVSQVDTRYYALPQLTFPDVQDGYDVDAPSA